MLATLVKLTCKTLWKNKFHTFFCVLGAVLGVTLLIGIMLIGQQMNAALKEQILDSMGNTDMMVGYRLQQKLLKSNEIEAIANTVGIQQASPVLFNPQRIQDIPSKDGMSRVYIGVDNSALTKSLYKFQVDLQEWQVVLSSSLAATFQVQVGDYVHFSFPEYSDQSWQVVEIAENNYYADGFELDIIFFHLPSLQKAFNWNNQANLVLLQLEPRMEKERIAYYLQRDIDEHLDFDFLAEFDLEKRNVVYLQGTGYILGFIALLASVLFVLSILQLSLYQRIQELATLRAIGANRKQLYLIILIEGVFLSTVGTCVGVLSGIALSKQLSITISNLINIPLQIIPVDWFNVISVATLCWIFIIGATMIPALRMRNVLPIQATRESYLQDTRPNRWHKWLLTRAERLLHGEVLVAVKNSFSQRKQFYLTVLMIVLGITLFVTSYTLFDKMTENGVRDIQRLYISDLVVKSNLDTATRLPYSLKEEMEHIPGVKAVITFSRNFSSIFKLKDFDYRKSSPDWLADNDKELGPDYYNPETREPLMAKETMQSFEVDLVELINQGWIAPIEDIEYAVVFPKEYAEGLGVEVNETILVEKLVYKGYQRTKNIETKITVTDIVDDSLGSFTDGKVVLIDRNHPILSGNGSVEIFLVQIDESRKEGVFADLERLKQKYPELIWSDKQGAIKELHMLMGQRMVLLWSALGIILITSILGMINTLSASFYAKRREYAILRVISLPPNRLKKLLFIQGSVVALVAIILGLLSANMLTYLLFWLLDLEFSFLLSVQLWLVILLFLVIALVSYILAHRLGKKSIMDSFN